MAGLIYGMMEHSTNADGTTRVKATTCDGGSTAGDWNTAGNPQKDLPAMAGAIAAKFKQASNLVLLYPASAAELVWAELVSGTGIYTGKTILEYAQTIYKGGVFPVGNDKAGLCVMTGTAVAHDDASAQVAAFCPAFYKIVSTKDITLEEWFNQDENCFYQRAQAYMSLVPIATKVGSYFYKAMSEIASIDLHD
jgi:hypothetical protein